MYCSTKCGQTLLCVLLKKDLNILNLLLLVRK